MIRHRSPGHDLPSDLLGRLRADQAGAAPAAVRRATTSFCFMFLDEGRGRFSLRRHAQAGRHETREILEVDADAIKADYLEEVASFREGLSQRLREGPYRLRSAPYGNAVR